VRTVRGPDAAACDDPNDALGTCGGCRVGVRRRRPGADPGAEAGPPEGRCAPARSCNGGRSRPLRSSRGRCDVGPRPSPGHPGARLRSCRASGSNGCSEDRSAGASASGPATLAAGPGRTERGTAAAQPRRCLRGASLYRSGDRRRRPHYDGRNGSGVRRRLEGRGGGTRRAARGVPEILKKTRVEDDVAVSN
jgi:hypothetical protein